MSVALLFLLLVALGAAAFPYILRSFMTNKLDRQMQAKQYDQAEQTAQSSIYRILFGSYAQKTQQLEIRMLMDDTLQVYSLCQQLLAGRLAKKERYAVANAAYHYFLNKEEKEYAQTMLEQLKLCADPAEIQYDAMLYRVLMESKSEDIDWLKEKLEEPASPQQKGYLQYLIGLQYIYQGNKKDAKVYLNRAKQSLKGTPYHKKIKRLMEE